MTVSGGSYGIRGSVCCGMAASSPLWRCGMIMKMTSSTSRISISGTTFTSETIPRLPTTTPMPMSHLAKRNPLRGGLSQHCAKPERELLSCFQLGGNQTHLVDARSAHDVDCARDVHEQHIVVALDESDFLGAVLEDLLDARPEGVPSGVFVVDLELVVLEHLNHNRLVLEFLVLLLVRRRLRHKGIHTLGRKGRDNHENDDKHQQNVDQRNDIRRCHCSRAITYIHPHCEIS